MSTQNNQNTRVWSAMAVAMGLLTQSLSADQPIGSNEARLPAVAAARLQGSRADNLQSVAARFDSIAGAELKELRMLKDLEGLLFGGKAMGEIFPGSESSTNSPLNAAGDPDSFATAHVPGGSVDGGRPAAPWERGEYVGHDPDNFNPSGDDTSNSGRPSGYPGGEPEGSGSTFGGGGSSSKLDRLGWVGQDSDAGGDDDGSSTDTWTDDSGGSHGVTRHEDGSRTVAVYRIGGDGSAAHTRTVITLDANNDVVYYRRETTFENGARHIYEDNGDPNNSKSYWDSPYRQPDERSGGEGLTVRNTDPTLLYLLWFSGGAKRDDPIRGAGDKGDQIPGGPDQHFGPPPVALGRIGLEAVINPGDSGWTAGSRGLGINTGGGGPIVDPIGPGPARMGLIGGASVAGNALIGSNLSGAGLNLGTISSSAGTRGVANLSSSLGATPKN